MRIQKTYCNALLYSNILTQKARNDSFDPTTVQSQNYKTWRTVLDSRTCLDCAENHGRIFDFNDSTVRLPPLHFNCRCTLDKTDAIKAGNATKNGKDGADYWLKHFEQLPDYYISREKLEALGWEIGDHPSKFALGKMLGGGIYNNDDKRYHTKQVEFGGKPISTIRLANAIDIEQYGQMMG